jgi:hypothetical protein
MNVGYFFAACFIFLPTYFGIASNINGGRAWRIGGICVISPVVVAIIYLFYGYYECGKSCSSSVLTFAGVLGLGGPVMLYGVGILIRAIYMAMSSPR